MKMGSNNQSIQVFLWCVAAIFLSAFTSLYCQIPGLFGNSGLYPASLVMHEKSACIDRDRRCHIWSKRNQCQQNAEWMLENCAKSCNSCRAGLAKFLNFPTLLWLTPQVGLTTETGMEFLCIAGVLLSFLMLLSSSARDCLNFFILGFLYFSLVQVGQVFLYYQWDTLLLETGFLAALVAPWNLYIGLWNIFKCDRVRLLPKQHDRINFWLVKWLLFRLMFASGIVKLLWMDPTWWGLTALNWHYESQCIPNAFAWYMQKLPTPFHRLSVVITYLIEIVTPFFFFTPFRAVRIFAFFSQILLQLMITSTGNYNFFNLLTISLCFSLLENKDLKCCSRFPSICYTLKEKLIKRLKKRDDLKEASKEKDGHEFHYQKDHHFGHKIEQDETSIWIICLIKVWKLVKIRLLSKRILLVEDFIKSRHFQLIKKIILAIIFASFMIVLLDIAVQYFGLRFDKTEFIHSQIEFTGSQFLKTLPVLIYVAIIIGIISLSFEIIAAFARCFIQEYERPVKLLAFLQCLFFGFVGVWIFGLSLVPFTELDAKPYHRVPTVFSKQHKRLEDFKILNAYGLFRSMTGIGGRPEVIIMGADSLSDNTTWKEYNFLYKPGNLYSAPTFNVPHQPRLDWQMWFAALQDYHANPWFVHLCYKLLKGEPAVLNLMGENPFKSKPPKYIRSVLYSYHFTLNKTGFWSALFKSSSEKRWWTREYVSEYMPIVSKNDTTLKNLLGRYGLGMVNGTEEPHFGLLHASLTFMSKRKPIMRAESLIYLKFVFLLLIVLVKHLWRNYGIQKIKPKIRKMDRAVKDKVFEISSRSRLNKPRS